MLNYILKSIDDNFDFIKVYFNIERNTLPFGISKKIMAFDCFWKPKQNPTIYCDKLGHAYAVEENI